MCSLTSYIAVPEGSVDLFKWAPLGTHTRPPQVELLSFQPRYSLKKGLFTTSKPKSIHWNVNIYSSSDAQTRGSRVSCLYALTGFFFASTVYKKGEEKAISKLERQAQTQKVTCTIIQHIECSMNQKCP